MPHKEVALFCLYSLIIIDILRQLSRFCRSDETTDATREYDPRVTEDADVAYGGNNNIYWNRTNWRWTRDTTFFDCTRIFHLLF